jgi:hypothetical protein
MRQFIIYRITFPTGQFYIGQTYSHEYVRWGGHLQDLKLGRHGNKAMQEIYNEYGHDDFVFEILIKDTSDDRAYVNLLERHTVKYHPNTINFHEGRKTDKQLEEHLLKSRKEYNEKNTKYGGEQLYWKMDDNELKEARRKWAKTQYYKKKAKELSST